MGRGTLRVYLGAAPGVGKTYAMLDEGWRRHERGTDVVVGYVETHGRPKTAAQLRELEVVPRRTIEYRGAALEEMDLDAVLARRPAVALVDELAHTNVPGSRNEKRWQDVEELLDAGIDVISTVNVQHLESLNDVVAKITGVTQHETVPDTFVRDAEQIELVDMTPEALRRRMAHGNIYPPERIDAALANYFRPGNLGALRELALLWVADRVQDSLEHYLADHGISGTWETRERVVLSLSGAPSGEALIRRAARMAARSRGDFLAVHVVPADGLARQGDPEQLAHQRRLVAELDGSYHEVVGDDVATALADFARGEKATQLVVGTSHRTAIQRLVRGSVVNQILERLDGVDVHVIADQEAPSRAMALPRLRRPTIPRRRRLVAWGLVAIGGPLLCAVLVPRRNDLALTTVTELFLALVLTVAAVGGLLPGVVASVAASLAINWFFTPPVHTWTISDPQNVVSLAVFLALTVLVSLLTDRVLRQNLAAQRARAEAEALAWSAAELVAAPEPLPLLLEHIRSTFQLASAAVLVEEAGGWVVTAAAGSPAPSTPAEGTTVELAPVDGAQQVLVLAGPALSTEERRVLGVLSNELSVALTARRLAEQAAERDRLAEADAVRTALLRSVSHDLRSPLAAIKAYVSGLRQPDVAWSRGEIDEALGAVEAECDRLNRVVGNLLDASRLQVGALAILRRPVAVDEVLADLVAGAPAGVVAIDTEPDLPLIDSDPVLLERALANVLENAVRFSPAGTAVRLQAQAVQDEVHIRVIDRGPGIAAADREQVFRPFQRIGDTGEGVGLGLSIARGFVEAIGASLELDDTPGGGLTVTVRLPIATAGVGAGP